MIQRGTEYVAKGEDAQQRGVERRRAVYNICGTFVTPEQKMLIERLEKGFHGDWEGRDPYNEIRQAFVRGIEIYEEELSPDGQWQPLVHTLDTRMTLGQEGAL